MYRIKNILVFLALAFTVLFILEIVVTNNLQSVNTKQNWILNLKNRNVDYVIIGSSKSDQGVDVSSIKNLTNLSGLNLSCNGCGIQEQYLLLDEFLKNNRCKNVVLMVDFTTLDPLQFTYPFHEYLYFHKMDNVDIASIIEDNTKSGKFYIWKFLPFMRYAEFNSEFKRMIIDKSSENNSDEFGFSKPVKRDIDLDDHRSNMFDANKAAVKNEVPKNGELVVLPKAEKYLNMIVKLSQRKKINLILMSFPENVAANKQFENTIRPKVRKYFYKLSKNEKLKYIDFTLSSISHKPDNFTSDLVHLNQLGLTVFTPLLSNSLIKNVIK